MKKYWYYLTYIFLVLKPLDICSDDTYKNFDELKTKEKINVDYKIETKITNSAVVIIAIHGGKIEKGTSEIARLLANKGKFNLYLFEGIKKDTNNSLHITSVNFDEKTGREIVQKSQQTISIHGCQGEESETYIGGLDLEAIKVFEKHLTTAGFVVNTPKSELAAKNLKNIVNDNKRKMGVQLELSTALRNSFLKGVNAEKDLDKYVNALLAALQELNY